MKSVGQQISQTSLDFIRGYNLPKTANITDVGGGDSRLVDFLLGEGFENITVLDISEKAINKAEERLRKSAAKVKWVVVDVTEFEPTQTYEPGEESYKEIPNYRNILVSHCICQVLN